MGRKVKPATFAVGGVTFLWLMWIAYSDYWVPSRDMQELGFDWVRPWTPRTIEHYRWMDGSQVIYTFEISLEMERILRTRCIGSVQSKAMSGTCYIARREEPARPVIEVELQRGVIRLLYTG